MAERYREGMSMKEIARRLTVNSTTVRYHLMRHSVPLRPRGRPHVEGTEESNEAERVTGTREGAMERVDG